MLLNLTYFTVALCAQLLIYIRHTARMHIVAWHGHEFYTYPSLVLPPDGISIVIQHSLLCITYNKPLQHNQLPSVYRNQGSRGQQHGIIRCQRSKRENIAHPMILSHLNVAQQLRKNHRSHLKSGFKQKVSTNIDFNVYESPLGTNKAERIAWRKVWEIYQFSCLQPPLQLLGENSVNDFARQSDEQIFSDQKWTWSITCLR